MALCVYLYVVGTYYPHHIDGYWWVGGCGYTLHVHYQLLAAERPLTRLEGLHKVR